MVNELGRRSDLVARRLVALAITFRGGLLISSGRGAAVGNALLERVPRVLLLHGIAWLS